MGRTGLPAPPNPGNKLGGNKILPVKSPGFLIREKFFSSQRFKVHLGLLAAQECRFKTGACFRVETVERKRILSGFLDGSVVKNLPASAGEMSSTPDLEDATGQGATQPMCHDN